MPRSIEHKIKILSRPSGIPSPSSQYGTIERELGSEHWHYKQSPSKKENQNVGGDYEIKRGSESFERHLQYSPEEIEQQQFSCRTFGEQHSRGAEEANLASNVRSAEIGERIPLQQSEGCGNRRNGTSQNEQLSTLGLSQHLVTTPIQNLSRESRDVALAREGRRTPRPSSQVSWVGSDEMGATVDNFFDDPSEAALDQNENNVRRWQRMPQGSGMKKVIRKSRLVSIHDGRPVSDFVDTVRYVPVDADIRVVPSSLAASTNSFTACTASARTHSSPKFMLSSCSSSCSLSDDDEERGRSAVEKNYGPRNRRPQFNARSLSPHDDSCSQSRAFFTLNPLYYK